MTTEADFFDKWMQTQPVPASNGRCHGCFCPTDKRGMVKTTDQNGTWVTGAYVCGDCQDRVAAGLPLHATTRIPCRRFDCRGTRQGRYERCNVCGWD